MIKQYIIAALSSVLVPVIIASAVVASIKGDFSHETESDDKVIIETTEAVKTAIIERRAITPKKGEYEREDTELIDLPLAEKTEVEETVSEPTEEVTPLYRCDGLVMDEDLQEYLYHRLCDYYIEWFFPYAIAQACQESEFDIYNVTNGLDHGLYQYRITYWKEKAQRYGFNDPDIFNPYVQIDIYVQEMQKRINVYGLDLYETISRHFTSDYGTYNAEYVDDVMERFETLERIR